MESLFEQEQKTRTCLTCNTRTTDEDGICTVCQEDARDQCRFCGYDVEDHTCIVDGIKICPDTEES